MLLASERQSDGNKVCGEIVNQKQPVVFFKNSQSVIPTCRSKVKSHQMTGRGGYRGGEFLSEDQPNVEGSQQRYGNVQGSHHRLLADGGRSPSGGTSLHHPPAILVLTEIGSIVKEAIEQSVFIVSDASDTSIAVLCVCSIVAKQRYAIRLT